MSENFQKKIEAAKSILEKGDLFIHLDPRKKSVKVPTWLKKQYQLVLQIGYDMAIPIPDLLIDASGIHATLSFSKTPIKCDVTWESIFALINDQGVGRVWAEDMPIEVEEEMKKEAEKHDKKLNSSSSFSKPGKPKKELPPYLRVIK